MNEGHRSNSMSSLINRLLNGFYNPTSTESEGKEIKMLDFKTNIPEFDEENKNLIIASCILEKLGNSPNPTAAEFYNELLLCDLPLEDHEPVTLAAISIETMMSLDMVEFEDEEPTIH